MREIEFRWKTPFGWQYWSTEKDYSLWLWSNRETLGQYTGLKDKNVVKIYEGDVLKFSWDSPCGQIEFFGVVRFIESEAAFRYFDETLKTWNSFHVDSNDMEVFGNIFDDPNLKKKYWEIYQK